MTTSVDDFLVVIKDLSKRFTPHLPLALDNINVELPKKKMIAMAGPDGAGKTTLMRLIAGLLLPTTGSITVVGFDTVKNAQQIHEIIGYMPQKFGLYEDLTVIQNLKLYAELRGLNSEDKQTTFDKLLSFTSLDPFKSRLAGDLSGGMKQKLGLACALIQRPTLLLLDEPSVGVDPISRRELWSMVHELLEEGVTVLWSTAYLDEAEKADRVILLNEGKMIYQGLPADLSKQVEGRSFKLTQIAGNRRQILQKALRQENISDGVIQGADVRIITKKNKPKTFDLTGFPDEPTLELLPVPPRFEDAFIDILGGGPEGESVLAAKTPEIKEKNDQVIVAEQLTKKFGDFTAADQITFKIKSGEIFGLLGPNGAGKSTTFKMMCGLLKPTSGKAFVTGLDLQKSSSEARSHIGYMAQKFSLYGNLSVLQNLEFFSGIYNLRGEQKKKMIEEMVNIFGLSHYLNDNADSLPLGFKQRLALACAVMHRPKVLFLDEPTSGVDPITRREFWGHINGLVEKGVTVMVTTHFMDEAEYCDRIALVYRSKIIALGTPEELKRSAINDKNPFPSLEDTFIHLVEAHDKEIKNA